MCILGNGTAQTPVTVLSQRITDRLRDGSFQRLRGEEIGLGPAQSARLQAIQELVSRLNQRSNVQLQSVRDVALLCQDFAESQRERLRIFYCSTDAKVLLQEDIAIGGMNMVTVSPREVFFPIRWHPVDSLVICHNHPSGNVQPSVQDKVFTTRIEAAAQLLGIWLRDHIIVGGGKTYSFREEGVLL
ncbi:hypothetical protein LRY60_05555 [Candidatus Woesebacteria bacterium]|nr:hypothetical protein [Candidatus Woesebacteria bacterium]